MGQAKRPDVCQKPNPKQMWGSSHPAPSNLSYIVKRPNGLSQNGFHITMASYHLEDDLSKCPVYEVRRVREQHGLEDEQKEPVTSVTLIGLSSGNQNTGLYEVYEPCSPNAMLPSILKLMTNFFIVET
ncbi:hypothetical protein CRG98_000728 [Punica granatum]|uniref:Uncharacterized protein n=1 Tax=Punica granatum TaxID=22663 RepID=A0A2I0LDW0_PUNGR|nr:hypothetical protein CRG98_000728 [Punica granatum]